MASILDVSFPEMSAEERGRLIPLASGSAGRAVALAALDVAPMERSALQILRSGDPDNSIRSGLASQLARKPAADRYSAFLELLPGLVAGEARQAIGGRRERLLGAYDQVRELSAVAPRLSLDPAATVFQLGGILASAAQPSLT